MSDQTYIPSWSSIPINKRKMWFWNHRTCLRPSRAWVLLSWHRKHSMRGRVTGEERVYSYLKTAYYGNFNYMISGKGKPSGDYIKKKKKSIADFLVVHWLRIHLPMQGTWIQFLLWEDSTYHGATKPVCPNCWAHTLEPFALWQEKPPQWGARAQELERPR